MTREERTSLATACLRAGTHEELASNYARFRAGTSHRKVWIGVGLIVGQCSHCDSQIAYRDIN
jgi:hypothetical protein